MKRTVALLVGLAVCSGASSALANDQADAALARGVELRRERRDAEALAEFRRAYEKEPSARALAQMGLAEGALEQWPSAAADLERALALGGDWVERQRKTLEDALAEIRTHLQATPEPAREHVVSPPSPPVARVEAAPAVQSSPDSVRGTLAWSAGAAALVFATGGVVATVVAAGKASHYDDASCDVAGRGPRSVQCAGVASQFHVAQGLEVASFALAAASAAASATLFLTLPRKDERSAQAWCTASAGGLACGSTF